jgi:hypothetical protein
MSCASRIQGEEKMLVYEYMPNKSLDSFIFGKLIMPSCYKVNGSLFLKGCGLGWITLLGYLLLCFKCSSIKKGAHRLEEAIWNHWRDSSRATLPSQVLEIEDNSPRFEGWEHTTWWKSEPQNFWFWHGKNFQDEWFRRKYKSNCWDAVSIDLQFYVSLLC